MSLWPRRLFTWLVHSTHSHAHRPRCTCVNHDVHLLGARARVCEREFIHDNTVFTLLSFCVFILIMDFFREYL